MDNRLSFPLGFKIVKTTGSDNTGNSPDERMVMDNVGTDHLKYDATANIPFYYEGLLSYVIGVPYHGSGVSNNSGYWFRYNDSGSYSWKGLDADTLDGKHANGTFSWTPGAGTSLVDYVNELKSLVDGLSTGLNWLQSVATYSSLPLIGNVANDVRVTQDTRYVWKWDGLAWIDIDHGFIPQLSNTVDGVVDHTWYNTLNSLVTTPSSYLNQNTFGTINLQQNGSNAGSIVSSSQTGSFTLNLQGGLSGSIIGSTINLSASGSSTSGTIYQIPYFVNTDILGTSSNFRFDGHGLRLNTNSNSVFIGTGSGGDTATQNIAVGVDALYNNNSFNTIGIGYRAGYLSTSRGSVYIGTQAGMASSTSYEFVLSTLVGSSTQSTLLVGDFIQKTLTFQGLVRFIDSDIALYRNGNNLMFKDPNTNSGTPVSLHDLYTGGSSHPALTLSNPAGVGGLTLDEANQVLSVGFSGTSSDGVLSSTDWNTFNNKQDALPTLISGKTLVTDGDNLYWANETTMNDPMYYRQSFGINTVGDIRIFVNTTGKYTQRWNGSSWIDKEIILW